MPPTEFTPTEIDILFQKFHKKIYHKKSEYLSYK